MKALLIKRVLSITFCVLFLFVIACGESDTRDDSIQSSADPGTVSQPDYAREEDPVKALILYSFSDSRASHMVRVEEGHGTINNKVLTDLLDFASWEESMDAEEGDPELVIEIGECNLELHQKLVKVQHLDVDWPTKLNFDYKWYSLSDEADEKVHEWLKTVNLDPFAYVGGTRIFKFVGQKSEIYRLKTETPVKIIFQESEEGSSTNYSTGNRQMITDLTGSFADFRIMEEQEKPEGNELTVTFVFEDNSEVQILFIGECLGYEGKYYSLYTENGFFHYVEQVKEGK